MAIVDYKNNLKALVDKAKQVNKNAHIILCTPSHTTDANRTPYIANYRTAMSEVATEKGVSHCRFENVWLEANTSTYCADGIHPNAAGHQLLFDQLWAVVQQGNWLIA